MKLKIPEILKITNPRWMKKIGKRRSWRKIRDGCVVDGKRIDLGMYGTCIVGEALNLKGKYDSDDMSKLEYHKDCSTCLNYSEKFYTDVNSLVWENTDIQRESFEDDLENFAEHLEEVHPRYITSAKRRNIEEAKNAKD